VCRPEEGRKVYNYYVMQYSAYWTITVCSHSCEGTGRGESNVLTTYNYNDILLIHLVYEYALIYTTSDDLPGRYITMYLH
jgi:hypothetical protein